MTDLREILPPAAFRAGSRHDKFQPKLEFDERCAILALVKAQVARPLLSETFSVDRRTIGHIVNKDSLHYRNVRAEFEKLGELDFAAKYVTEDIKRRLVEKAQAFRLPEPEPEETSPNQPSRRANRRRGINSVRPDQCAYVHRIDIQWMDEPAPGWYYRDLDSSDPEEWLHNGEESRKTSQNCLTEAMANLIDG